MDDELPDECCAKCRFTTLASGSDSEQGYCQRFPPSLLEIDTQSVDIEMAIESSHWWGFPVIEKDNWCGEFQPQKDTPS